MFASIDMSLFFANKEFHSRMSFTSDITTYAISRERLQAAAATSIVVSMKETLKMIKRNAKKSQRAMKQQVNKHRKQVKYNIENRVFLSSRNIPTSRSCSKLKNKMLGSFPIIDRAETFYRLELPDSMKIHLVFHPHLLRKDPRNPLPEQIQQSPKPTETPKGKEFDLIDILNSR